jgi:hypothetical protein
MGFLADIVGSAALALNIPQHGAHAWLASSSAWARMLRAENTE